MPFETTTEQISYLKLFVVVLFGVAGGNMLANWITARALEYTLATAASEAQMHMKQESARANEAAVASQLQSQQAQEAQQASLQQARREDKIGVKLSRTCEDWTKANLDLHSYTTQTEQDKACSRFNAYIQSGVATKN